MSPEVMHVQTRHQGSLDGGLLIIEDPMHRHHLAQQPSYPQKKSGRVDISETPCSHHLRVTHRH